MKKWRQIRSSQILKSEPEEEVVELRAGGGALRQGSGLGGLFENDVEASEFFLVESEFGFGELGFFAGCAFAMDQVWDVRNFECSIETSVEVDQVGFDF